MRFLLCLVLCVGVCPGLAFAQAGAVGLFADPGAIDCHLTDRTQGVVSYYAVHVLSHGATACQFSAPAPGCLLGSWLSDETVFPVTIGDSQSGVAVGYGVCLSSPIHVLTINYFVTGATPNCCSYPVLPDPNLPSGEIEVVDCSNTIVYGIGIYGAINRTEACECEPNREATWGGVKSIYSE